MRSSPTRSTEGGGSHHGLHGRWRGQAWVADEEVDTRKDNEVSEGGGGLVVLLWLWFLSRRLLFLSGQSGRAKVLRDCAVVYGWGASS
jgi:hypothetical protein